MIAIKIEGVEDIGEALKVISQKAQREIGLEAVATALTPVVTAARRYARRSRDTGNLEASIGLKTKEYRKRKSVLGIVGPRHGFKVKDPSGKGFRVASKYAHLVEFGTKTAGAKPFMRPAWLTQKSKVESTLGNVFGTGVKAAAERVYKRRRKKS